MDHMKYLQEKTLYGKYSSEYTLKRTVVRKSGEIYTPKFSNLKINIFALNTPKPVSTGDGPV